MLLVAILLSGLVGASLGLLGGGGSILTLPILRYALGMDAHPAIALSLLVVSVTSAAALIPHARRHNVRWRVGVVFGFAGMIGAYGAGRVAEYLPAVLLLLGFSIMMFITAIATLRGRRPRPDSASDASGGTADSGPQRASLPLPKVIADGLVVGAVTGLVGAGGGFLVVPALVLLGGLPMEVAVGTSLLVIAMKSLAGFAGFVGHTPVDWTLAAAITGAAVAGSVVGSLISRRVPGRALREGFGWFVVATAFFLLAQELPLALGRQPSLLIALSVSLTGTLLFYFGRRLLRRIKRKPPAQGPDESDPTSRGPGKLPLVVRVVPSVGTDRVTAELGGKAS